MSVVVFMPDTSKGAQTNAWPCPCPLLFRKEASGVFHPRRTNNKPTRQEL